MKARSALVVFALVGLSLGTAVPRADAVFHLMKVREVFAGSLLDPSSEFVELQMYSAGQNQVSGHKVTLYNETGASRECTMPANVTNPSNQETILLATSQAQTQFGIADFTLPSAFLVGSGGAVCFENIDCVSWGSFSAATTSPAGTPEPGGIPVGESIDRRTDIAGGPGTLENDDDTNDSANDFEREAPSANPNGPVNLGTANCVAGTQPVDDEAPTSKITAPKHQTAIARNESTNFQGTAKDQGSGDVTEVEIALRQKRKGGCKWWNGRRFVAGGCSSRRFLAAAGTTKWEYDLSKTLTPTGGRVRHYTLFSRATDAAGNVEADFIPKVNLVKFEVFKPPITCEPGC